MDCTLRTMPAAWKDTSWYQDWKRTDEREMMLYRDDMRIVSQVGKRFEWEVLERGFFFDQSSSGECWSQLDCGQSKTLEEAKEEAEENLAGEIVMAYAMEWESEGETA